MKIKYHVRYAVNKETSGQKWAVIVIEKAWIELSGIIYVKVDGEKPNGPKNISAKELHYRLWSCIFAQMIVRFRTRPCTFARLLIVYKNVIIIYLT